MIGPRRREGQSDQRSCLTAWGKSGCRCCSRGLLRFGAASRRSKSAKVLEAFEW